MFVQIPIVKFVKLMIISTWKCLILLLRLQSLTIQDVIHEKASKTISKNTKKISIIGIRNFHWERRIADNKRNNFKGEKFVFKWGRSYIVSDMTKARFATAHDKNRYCLKKK